MRAVDVNALRARAARAAAVIAAATVAAGCYPPAASLQDARVVGEGGVRIAGYWSGLDRASGDGEKLADVYGVMLGIGASGSSEFQLRFDHFDPVEEGEGYHFFSLGPKFALVEDRLALVVPAGVYAGEAVEFGSFQIHPGLLGTVPVGRTFELNAAAKLMLPIDQDYFTWGNVGVGFGWSSDIDRWIILPEVSYTVCLDESDVDPVFSYGIALVILTGN